MGGVCGLKGKCYLEGLLHPRGPALSQNYRFIHITFVRRWLDRRTTFTRSLTLMSMAGYILGLGDRHPSNLMLERTSGRVVHIDFGDCFDVCKKRAKFPGRVPFRLTRMLVNAMEVCA